MNVKEQLVAELDERLEALGGMELGTDEYKTALDSLLKLVDRITEIEKNESDSQARDKQMKSDKSDRIIRYAFEGGKLLILVGGFWASMNFEKYATLTTPGGRKAIDKILSLLKI